jgi:hypothetical protein
VDAAEVEERIEDVALDLLRSIGSACTAAATRRRNATAESEPDRWAPATATAADVGRDCARRSNNRGTAYTGRKAAVVRGRSLVRTATT